MPSRFLDLDGVSRELAVSRSQAYALVRRGQLRAIKVGGRGVWRVERVELEAYVAAAYAAVQGEDRGAADDKPGGEKPDRGGARGGTGGP